MKKYLFAVLPALVFLLAGCYDAVPVATNPDYFSRAAKGLREAKEISDTAAERARQAEELLGEEEPADEPSVEADRTYFRVARIIDGDTFEVETAGGLEKVRLIGVNTPESVDPRRPVECFGREASAKAEELLGDKEVELEADPSQTDRDRYGRLLRYVRTREGLFYNLEIIKLGYAHEYTFDLPYKYQAEFKAAQLEAQNKKAGLWADGACGEKNIR